MKKIKYFIFILILLCISINVNAKKVTCSTGEFTASIEIDKEKIGIDSFSNIKITSESSYDVTYKVGNKDILTVQDNGLIKGLNEGNTVVTVEIDFIKEGITSPCKVELPIEVVSSDSKLKMLEVEGVDLSNVFKSTRLEYNIDVPYKRNKIKINAEPNSDSAIIKGLGEKQLLEGKNVIEILVTADDGSATMYRLNITRKEPNKDAKLKSITIDGYNLTPTFDKDIHKYTVNINEEIVNIKINAETNDENALVSGVGEFRLASGKNLFTLVVTAENGYTDKYEIEITKINGDSLLKKLSVKDYKFDEKWNPKKFIYHVTVGSKTNSLDISFKSYNNDQVEIIDNEKFKEGENVVLVRVTAADKAPTTYKIIVNKLSEEDESNNFKNNILLRILLTLFIFGILFTIGSICIFIKRNYETIKIKNRINRVNKRKKKRRKEKKKKK